MSKQPTATKAPTGEELQWIKEAILLPLVLTALERDGQWIRLSKIKTKQPYLDVIERAMQRITDDLVLIRRHFRERGIKILSSNRSSYGIHCTFLCRGYESHFELLWYYARGEAEQKMKHYLN
jgi:hypothetical protein